MGRATQIRCHGDDTRFAVLAAFIYEYFGNRVKYIADIAGGQGFSPDCLPSATTTSPR